MTHYQILIGHADAMAVRHTSAETLTEAVAAAEALCRAWLEAADWPPEGGDVRGWYRVHTAGGRTLTHGHVVVHVPPDEPELLARAVEAAHPERAARMCGMEPSDHEWSEPLDWSGGGTVIERQSHCKRCGLRRIERLGGAERVEPPPRIEYRL